MKKYRRILSILILVFSFSSPGGESLDFKIKKKIYGDDNIYISKSRIYDLDHKGCIFKF